MISTKGILKRIAGFSVATWVNCVISFVALPIVTKFFSPMELGKVNLFVSYADILIPFVYLGFDQAFARYYNEPVNKNDSNSMGRICISISGMALVCVSTILFIFYGQISTRIIGERRVFIVICMIGYLFATYVMRYMEFNARMANDVKKYGIQAVLVTVVVKLSFVGVVLVKPVAEYAIAFRSFCYLLVAMFFLVDFYKKKTEVKCDWSKDGIVELTKYAIPIFPTVLLLMFDSAVSQLMLSRYMDYSDIGIYSNALSIAAIIMIVQSGINIFWAPFVFESYKDGQARLQKAQQLVSCVLIGFGFAIILCQNPIYWILVNKQYWGSKKIFALLIISPICKTISETLGIGIEISKKTYLKFPVYLINIVTNVFFCIVLIPRFGTIGAAFSTVIASLVMLTTKAAIGERFYKCCDNYYKLFAGLSLLIAAAVINAFVEGLFKFALVLFAMALCMVVYRQEIKTMMNFIWGFIKNRKRG
ncbi:MAG: lipopolysaccharide biosynthesis protein [Clostridiales bacterium]|nr:lipopolysaccharide biosynthesis protein [Candidatus Crickella merdequi]